MSGDITPKAQNAFKSTPNSESSKPEKRYPTPVSVRFTDDERTLLKDKAGDLTISAYIRLCVLGEDAPKHRTRRKKAVADYEALGQVLGSLGRSNVPNNINQLTKAVNTGDLPLAGEMASDLKQAAFELAYNYHFVDRWQQRMWFVGNQS